VETTPFVACRWDVFASGCPSRQVLGRVADKWTMLVISALAESEVLRFSELRRRVEGVTQKMLTQTLRGLERDGLVSRTVYPTVPATVEYRLTPLGASLAGAVSVIKDWAYANIEQIERARGRYDALARQAQRRPDHPQGRPVPGRTEVLPDRLSR
jgi:DNA-binding HxlR family transcriptional regulator